MTAAERPRRWTRRRRDDGTSPTRRRGRLGGCSVLHESRRGGRGSLCALEEDDGGGEGGRTVKGKGDDGRRQRGWTTVPLPQFARQEGDAAAGETDESASASPPPAPTQAWRRTMGIRGTAAKASLTPLRVDLPSSMTLEELNSAKRDVEAGGEDGTPAVISPETRDASPPLPRTMSRA